MIRCIARETDVHIGKRPSGIKAGKRRSNWMRDSRELPGGARQSEAEGELVSELLAEGVPVVRWEAAV